MSEAVQDWLAQQRLAYRPVRNPVRDAAFVRDIRCADCQGTSLQHGADGRCLLLERDVMPWSYTLLSARRDERVERENLA